MQRRRRGTKGGPTAPMHGLYGETAGEPGALVLEVARRYSDPGEYPRDRCCGSAGRRFRRAPFHPMPQLDEPQVLEILAPIRNREFGGESIVSLGQVADIRICRPLVSVAVILPNVGSAVAEEVREQVRDALLRLPEIERAEVAVRTEVSGSPTSRVGQAAGPPSGPAGPRAPMPDPTKPEGVQNVVAIASGKGGVGKSTVSANLAAALVADGARVGLLDADVYGPSQTTMFGMDDRPATDEHRRLLPLAAHGVRFISMGMLSSKETPVIWRGPMASRLVQQFFSGVVWGELDYLLVDLPPGTGDVQLTIAQTAALAGAVIVTTPQAVARTIAEKGLRMFQPVRVPVLGVIENMRSFVCPHCGECTDIFSTGGGEEVAGDLGLPFLGGVPLDPRVVVAGDEGTPTVVRDPESPAAVAYREIARRVALEVARSNQAEQAGVAESVGVESEAVVVRWHDGSEDRLGFEYLRNHCPCATCVDEWSGQRRSLTLLLPSNFAPRKLVPVGNYGVQIHWNDGHETGIYSHHLLRRLAKQQQEAPTPVG